MMISDDPIILRDDVTSLGDYVAPNTPEERTISEIWERVLRIDRVGINDSYFDLNGESLSAVTLVMEVEKRFVVTLGLAAILDEGSTVAGMARLVAAERDGRIANGSGQSSSEKVEQGVDVVHKTESAALVARRFRLVSGRDLIHTFVFLALIGVAGLGSPRWWRKLSSFIATVQVKVRGSQPDLFCGGAAAAKFNLEPAELKQRLLGGVYEDFIYMLREHLPGGWHPDVDIHGIEHIDQALEGGQGVILWIGQSVSGELARAKAISEAGFPPVILSHTTHPYSSTAYGRRVLNPIRTRIEDRYFRGRALIGDGDAVRAIQEIRDHLHENHVIAIAAIDDADRPLELPFLGGRLSLGIGAAFLAALDSAPLLPVFTVSKADGAFEVLVEPPLQDEVLDGQKPNAEQLAMLFAVRLESHVRRHPAMWSGWLTGSQWRPKQTEHEVANN